MRIAQFMASPVGRGGRIVVGLAIIGVGLGVVGGAAGLAIAAVGLLPIGLGVINGCLLAPVLSVPFRGCHLVKAQTDGAADHGGQAA